MFDLWMSFYVDYRQRSFELIFFNVQREKLPCLHVDLWMSNAMVIPSIGREKFLDC